ncbi:MAG: glycosyltransferase family 2 protein [Pyrinomonadaceae bacterium]
MKAGDTGLNAVQLSIIVASTLSQSFLKNCLDSILSNKLDGAEIIVADCCLEESFEHFSKNYPSMHFLQFERKVTLPVLLAAGLERATGDIIAMTDTSCRVADNWIHSIMKAHQSQAMIIGGAVEVSESRNGVDWAAYFCDYSEFMPPMTRGAANVVPGNNISFKRTALTKGKEFTENSFWKTLWVRKLQDSGVELIAEPSILVYFTKSYDLLPFLIRRFHHGRCFAGLRVIKLNPSKRAFYFVGSFVLPFIFLARTVSHILAKNRRLKELLFSSPIIILAIVSWSFGETCGYFAGAGKSCQRIY